MNYNSEVINQINKFVPNEIIVARKLYQEKLSFVPEATFFKALERMMKENKLTRISKGVYSRPKTTRFGVINLDVNEIVHHYLGRNNKNGMITGYRLFNKYGITTQISKRIELYSNIISEDKKVVGNITIKKIFLQLDENKTRTIEALEIIQHYNEIEDLNPAGFLAYLKGVANRYNDSATKEVLSRMRYKKSTIAFLQMVLKYFGVKNTLSSYLTNTSVYKIPTMEELNELAGKNY